jgi:hypothetical protein
MGLTPVESGISRMFFSLHIRHFNKHLPSNEKLFHRRHLNMAPTSSYSSSDLTAPARTGVQWDCRAGLSQLVWLGPESAQVPVQKVMKACARCSEYLTGLPKRRFKPNLSRHCRSSITFSGLRLQGGSLPPDLRGHRRPDISLPLYLLCFTFPVFSRRARFGRLTLLYLSTIPLARCGLPKLS